VLGVVFRFFDIFTWTYIIFVMPFIFFSGGVQSEIFIFGLIIIAAWVISLIFRVYNKNS
jgi:hypothetical protein